MDVFSRAKRSEVMSRIRSRGNKDTELAMARLLRQSNMSGWRRHYGITGRPDFAFVSSRVAVFVDGCFWHACPRCGVLPRNNRKFWMAKLSGNVARDRRVTRALRGAGWTVLRIWEHEFTRPEGVVSRLQRSFASAGNRAIASRKLHGLSSGRHR